MQIVSHCTKLSLEAVIFLLLFFYLTLPRLTKVGQRGHDSITNYCGPKNKMLNYKKKKEKKKVILLQGLLVSGATRRNSAGCHVSFIIIIISIAI